MQLTLPPCFHLVDVLQRTVRGGQWCIPSSGSLFSLADVTHSFQCTAQNWLGGEYVFGSPVQMTLPAKLPTHFSSSVKPASWFCHLVLMPRLGAVLASSIQVRLRRSKRQELSAMMLHRQRGTRHLRRRRNEKSISLVKFPPSLEQMAHPFLSLRTSALLSLQSTRDSSSLWMKQASIASKQCFKGYARYNDTYAWNWERKGASRLLRRAIQTGCPC